LARAREKIAQDGLIFSFKIHVSWASLQSVTTYRVVTGQEMVRKKFFKVREFYFELGKKLTFQRKVREN